MHAPIPQYSASEDRDFVPVIEVAIPLSNGIPKLHAMQCCVPVLSGVHLVVVFFFVVTRRRWRLLLLQ